VDYPGGWTNFTGPFALSKVLVQNVEMDSEPPVSPFLVRYLRRTFSYVQKNPQLGLAAVLFVAGVVALVNQIAALAGALFGAGATLLGTWITALNTRRAAAEERSRQQSDARQYLAPELHRAILRVLHIHDRAIANFICASAEHEIKPNDLKEDFIPSWPVLYPNAPQVHQLSGDEATALIAFYDSLHSLAEFVNGWWEREGQLPVNIFNMILHNADESLKLALPCVEKFELERLYPQRVEALGTISSRIEGSRSTTAKVREGHIRRFEAKRENKAAPATPKRRNL
jgi:hypothetical protein